MEQCVLGMCHRVKAGEGTHAYLQREGGDPLDGAGELHQA